MGLFLIWVSTIIVSEWGVSHEFCPKAIPLDKASDFLIWISVTRFERLKETCRQNVKKNSWILYSRGPIKKQFQKTRASCFIRDCKHLRTIKAFICFHVFGNPAKTLALVLKELLWVGWKSNKQNSYFLLLFFYYYLCIFFLFLLLIGALAMKW